MNPYQQGLLLKQSETQDVNQLKELNKREDSFIEIDLDNDNTIKQYRQTVTRYDEIQNTDNRHVSFQNISQNTFRVNNMEDISTQRPTLLQGDSNRQNNSRTYDYDELIGSSQRSHILTNFKEDASVIQDNQEVSFRVNDNQTYRSQNQSPVRNRGPMQTKYTQKLTKRNQDTSRALSSHNNFEGDLNNQLGNENSPQLDFSKKKSIFNNFKNVNLLAKMIKKMLYFYSNYTDHGRMKNLNNSSARDIISDKSDYQTSTLKKKKIKLDKIGYYWRKIQKRFWRLSIFSAKMINPQHTLSIVIQLIFISSNFYYFFKLSLLLVFSQDAILSEFYDRYILIQWVIELFIKVNTAVFMKTNYIDTRKEAAFDILPLIFVFFEPGNFVVKQIFRVIQFLKLYNTLKDKQEVEQQLLMILRSHYFVQLINLVIQLFFVGHVIACSWYFVGRLDQEYFDRDKSWMTLLIDQEDDFSKIYVVAFYWAFTLMATGSNVANTTLEVYFTSIIMLFTTIVFGYMVNEIGIILSDINQSEEKQRKDINIINNYMGKKEIPKTLQRRVNLDLENYYLKNLIQKTEEEQEVLSKISKELNEALKIEYNKNILSEIKLLVDNFSDESLRQLCLEVEEVFYSPDQIIFKEEDLQLSLMFIVSGKVEIFQQQAKNKDENQNIGNFFQAQNQFDLNQKINIIIFLSQSDWRKQFDSEKYSKALSQLKKGDVFGEINFFTGMARNESAKSKDFTTIIKIDRQQFIDIIKNKEKDFQTFCQIKDKLLMYNMYSSIKLSCLICNSTSHLKKLCPLAHFNKDNQYVIQRFNKSIDQERNSNIHRRSQKAFHSRLQIDFIFQRAEEIRKGINTFNQLRSYFQVVNSDQMSEDEDDGHSQVDYSRDESPRFNLQNFGTQQDEDHNKQLQSNDNIQSNQNIPSSKDINKFKLNFNVLDYYQSQRTIKQNQENASSDKDNDNQHNSDKQNDNQYDESNIRLNFNTQRSRYYEPSDEQTFIEAFKKYFNNAHNYERINSHDYQNLRHQQSLFSKSKTNTSVEKQLNNAQNKRLNFKQNAYLTRQSTVADKNKQKPKIHYVDSNNMNEENKQLNLLWEFDSLKDFLYYFTSGNSKNVLTRFNLLRKIYSKKKITKVNKSKGDILKQSKYF